MYLYGASGHAMVIMDILEACGIPLDGLYDDNPDIATLMGIPVSHSLSLQPPRKPQAPFIISIGNNRIRRALDRKLAGKRFGTAIHPSALISPHATVGEGSVVMQGAIIQTSASIGRHAIINTAASIDHECCVGDYVHISPHATLCGNVHVGEGSWIGAGSALIQGIRIGRWCVVGAGSVVTRDLPDGVLAYGNNCKIIKQLPLPS